MSGSSAMKYLPDKNKSPTNCILLDIYVLHKNSIIKLLLKYNIPHPTPFATQANQLHPETHSPTKSIHLESWTKSCGRSWIKSATHVIASWHQLCDTASQSDMYFLHNFLSLCAYELPHFSTLCMIFSLIWLITISDRWVGAMSVKCLSQGHLCRSVLVLSIEPGTLWFRYKRLNHWATAPHVYSYIHS